MKKVFIFIVLILLTISFLFLQEWNWLYLDTSYVSHTMSRAYEYILTSFLTFYPETTFGFDNTILNSTRYIQGFITFLGQKIAYILFFVGAFSSAYFLLKEKFSKNTSFYGALLYAFNPISLYFLSQIGFCFVYFSLPLVILGFFKFFTTAKARYIIFSLLGFAFMLSYTRATGIYALFLILVGLFHWDFIWNILKNKKKLFVVYMVTHILFFLPFLFAFLFPYFSGDNLYFAGLWNYASSHMQSWVSLYNFVNNSQFFEWFIPTDITNNIAYYIFQNGTIFQIVSLIFIFTVFLWAVFYNYKKKDTFVSFLIVMFVCLIFVRMAAKFLPQDIFIAFVYKHFPFLANNLSWIYIIYIPIIVYLFVFCVENANVKYGKSLLYSVLGLYIMASIFPFVNFNNNYKLATIDVNVIPQNYRNTFFQDKLERNSSMFLPGAGLYMDWSPYVFEFGNNSIYQTVFMANARLVNKKQSTVNDMMHKFTSYSIDNLNIFNLKNIFVFHDVRNPKEGQFDFYPIEDYALKSEKYYKQLIGASDLYIKQDNPNFTQFGFKKGDDLDFFVYAPASIYAQDIDNFFDKKLDITQKPVNIDSQSFHYPQMMKNFTIPENNKNIHIEYKKSSLQPSKIYLKFSQIDTTQSFLLQLNQTFWISWKLKWISKQDFEEKKCESNWESFKLTQNSNCNYKSQILDLWDIKYLNYPSIPEENHFEWNFVWNTWLIRPNDIPNNIKNESELYAVIIYEKQIWYNIALVISWFTFTCLLLLTAYQELKNIFKKK